MSHTPCPRCNRLLAPVDGQLPLHLKPTPREPGMHAQPLTGRDSQWCDGQKDGG